MKKSSLTFILFLAVILSSTGQTEVGAKGGANLSWINFDRKESLFSFHAGGYVRAPLGEELFLQPEVLYSVKGANIPDYFYSTSIDFTMYYLSFPVLLGWQASENLSLHVGPEISYLTNATVDIADVRHEGKDGFAAWDLDIDLGAAYQLTKRLGLELRYSHGLVNVIQIEFTDENGQSLGGIDEGKNRVLQLGLWYSIFPGREIANGE
jgi:Outer membrane protein beta-barrel domain